MKQCPLVVKVKIGVFQVVSSVFYTSAVFLLERQMVTGFISLTKRWVDSCLLLPWETGVSCTGVQPRSFERDSAVLLADLSCTARDFSQ